MLWHQNLLLHTKVLFKDIYWLLVAEAVLNNCSVTSTNLQYLLKGT